MLLTLMLKEMVFLFEDIFGLGISSESDSSLCSRQKKQTQLAL